MRDGLECSYCKTEITSGQQISQCLECRVSTHVTCSYELLPDCTVLKEEKAMTPNNYNGCNLEQNSEIESWVTIWE